MEKTVLMLGVFASGWSGTRVYCEDFAHRLRERGWRVLAASSRANRLARAADMAAAILRWPREYQLAHLDVYTGAAFWWALQNMLLLRALRKPVVLSLHGGNLPAFAQRHPRAVDWLLSNAHAVTTPSGYLADAMAAYRQRIDILPNALDLSAYAFHLRENPQPRLIWLRGFHQVYNPAMAVAVLARVRQTHPQAHLVMLGPDKGDGSLEETKKQIQILGVAEAITLTGAVPKHEVPRMLDQGDIFLNTSNVDNTPVTVIEAMACGMGVVSTNVGGIAHLLTHGETALLSPAGDAPAMAANVCALLNQPGLAARLSQNARLQAERLDWPGILDRWEALFTGILEQR